MHWHPQNPTLFLSASDDTRIKLWGLTEYPVAELSATKPKKIEFDPTTNTSFGATGTHGIVAVRPPIYSSSDDFDSSGEEIDEENDDEEGWGGLN